ncbi:LLM class flavin-dependent oxidoreductase [Desmospora activa]|uniref:FMN-dependent oxidoreductase (Nitrilotriacetate monooxygenase family) n=1 Tax=Desmospora activa DSM 45169 TaxID=1121389 RepID=A0A2T4Z3U9_9BACL|nr:LLM class flavin-dependent oxidoreductase [Desmospora activa]PTM56562.1 FMN-dependent oxidoreductase (nitrilotriacetate monooxygenase family) [Desmospora activa DSM 45169]
MGKQRSHIKIGVFIAGTGHHVASWRHPQAQADGTMNLSYLKGLAQTAERGKLDMLFLADSLSIDPHSHPNILARFEPLTVLSSLAEVTSNIGLVATASTTYGEPFHTARQFASLDHISNGRAGWNVVTSSIPATGANFSKEEHLEHGRRYQRAQEFVEVVKGLWDSWEEDALVRDKESGVFFDPDKLHELNHKGEFFSVRGPLNIARSPQGHPVIVQAGSSESGQQLAAQTAEVIFTAQNHLAGAQAFYRSVKEKVASQGRLPEEVSIMPGIFPVIAETEALAQEKYEELQDLIIPSVGLKILSTAMGGVDLTPYPLDGPLPEIELPESNAVKSRSQLIKEMAQRENLTIRQLYKKVAGSRGHHIFIGTPEQLADRMEEWFTQKGADGFNLMPPLLPEGLELFVGQVVPILQERGLFRREYEGKTLRDHLGLKKP